MWAKDGTTKKPFGIGILDVSVTGQLRGGAGA
jgi:hypothetical protein